MGQTAVGSMSVSAGGTVSNTYALIGVDPRSQGSVTVSGGNWTHSGDLTIGQNSGATGELNLGGGLVTTAQVAEGSGNGSVTFNGGTLRLSDDQTSLFSGFEPGDVVLINPGGTIDTQSFQVSTALALTGNGSLTKKGSGTLSLGGNSTYAGGTTVRNGLLALGGNISNPSTEVIVGQSLGDNASLEVNKGGSLTSKYVYLGNEAGSQGRATVTGGNWTNSQIFYVGKDGNGTLVITDNGVVNGGSVVVGSQDSTSLVRVENGSFLNALLTVGFGGKALVEIDSTSSVISRQAIIGNRDGDEALGTVRVNGGNWTVSEGLIVGANGKAELDIIGGRVGAGVVWASATPFSSSNLTLNGGELATYVITSGSVPGSGPSHFLFQNGGTLKLMANSARIFDGYRAGGIVLGTGGGVIDTQSFAVGIDVGLTGTGSLTKLGNGTLTLNGTHTYAGNTTISRGTLALAGNGSISHSSANLYVGNAASDNATATLSHAAFVTSNETFIAKDAGSTGRVQITGGNLTTANRLFVGYSGSGSLELTDVGRVTSDTTFIGTTPEANGALNVAGGNLTNTNNLIVGHEGTGRFTLSNGTVSNVTGFIGAESDSSGSATATGGTWINTDALFVGDAGTGTLTIAGGIVSAPSVTLANAVGSNGTLNFGTGTSVGTLIAGNITGVDGTALVNFNHSGILRLTPTLSGSLVVNHLGTGSTILTAANTYTSGTTVTSGRLQTNHLTALGTGPVTINGGTLDPVGTLTINSLTWNGGMISSSLGASMDLIAITGPLELAAGGGTFAFVADEGFAFNTPYTILRAANLTDAFLSLFSGNSLGNIYPVFTRRGPNLVVTFHRTAPHGALDGPLLQNSSPLNTPPSGVFTVNHFVQTGSPIQNNTIFGLIFNPGSQLHVFNTLTVTGGNMTVTGGNAGLTGDTVFIPGNLTKNGSGTLNVQALLNTLGFSTVNSGGLYVNGILRTLRLNVRPNGTLGGTGTIFGDVINFGNVSPGNSPGTMTIVGNFSQTSQGTLTLEIASPTIFDQLNVSGIATLGGTLAVQNLGTSLSFGKQYPFLQASTLSSAFDRITMPDPGTYRGRLLSRGGTGILLVAPASYTLLAQTPNQSNVAHAVDGYIHATSGDRAAVSLALDLQSTDQYPAAFQAISPAQYENLASTSIEQSNALSQILQQRFSTVRLTEARGFTQQGLKIPIMSESGPNDAAKNVHAARDIFTPAPGNNWGSWVQGDGLFGDFTGLATVPNSRFSSGGVTAGLDYRFPVDVTLGLFAGYQGLYSKYANGGRMNINTVNFGLYVAFEHTSGFYANFILGGGYSGYQVTRPIAFSTIDRSAKSDPSGALLSTTLDLGYDWKVAGFTITPTLAAQFTYTDVAPFTESGADSLDLRLNNLAATSLRTSLGARAAYPIRISRTVTFIPQVSLVWQHEFLQNSQNIAATLDGGEGPGFDYATSTPSRDAAYAGAGFSLNFGETVSFNANYNVNFGRQDFLSNMVSGGFTLSF